MSDIAKIITHFAPANTDECGTSITLYAAVSASTSYGYRILTGC